MKKRQGKKSLAILALLALGAFTLTFELGAVGAMAQQDTDKDGFTDLVETTGFDLPSGMSLAAYQNPPVTHLGPCAPGVLRDKCVDPATKDYFVIIKRATVPCASKCGDPCPSPLFGSSNIPMPANYATTYNPLGLVYPGLGVATHEILQTGGPNQVIGPTPPGGGWYAVKIVEDLNPCSSYMGLSKFGVPYSGSVGTVWPEKIKNWINKQCSNQCFDLNADGIAETCYTPTTAGVSTFTCKNANSNTSVEMTAANPDLSPLYYDFLQNVISHEVSHMMNLAAGSSPTGGTSADHHYTIIKGVLMEQSVGATTTRSIDTSSGKTNINVNLFISTAYTAQDKAQYKLK